MKLNQLLRKLILAQKEVFLLYLKHTYYRRIERQECEPLAHATVRRFSTSLCRIIVRSKKVLNLRGLQM